MHEDIVDRLQRKKKGTNVVIVGVGNALGLREDFVAPDGGVERNGHRVARVRGFREGYQESVTIIGRRRSHKRSFLRKS